MDVKQYTTIQEQLKKLEYRNCFIENTARATEILESINYYRLTAYFLPFKKSDDTYIEGTTLEKVYQIYEFDRKLRHLLFEIIEEIEIMLRRQLSNLHAERYGALGYQNSDNFSAKHNHQLFLDHIQRNIENNKTQPCVKHHFNKYNGNFPIWVILELSTMGELSYFFSDMHMKDRKALSRNLFHTVPKNINSWLLCLTNLRNYCAHYNRLYYTIFPAQPAIPEDFPHTLKKRIFDYILVLKFLYPNKAKWNLFVARLQALLEEYREVIQFSHIWISGKLEKSNLP